MCFKLVPKCATGTRKASGSLSFATASANFPVVAHTGFSSNHKFHPSPPSLATGKPSKPCRGRCRRRLKGCGATQHFREAFQEGEQQTSRGARQFMKKLQAADFLNINLHSTTVKPPASTTNQFCILATLKQPSGSAGP